MSKTSAKAMFAFIAVLGLGACSSGSGGPSGTGGAAGARASGGTMAASGGAVTSGSGSAGQATGSGGSSTVAGATADGSSSSAGRGSGGSATAGSKSSGGVTATAGTNPADAGPREDGGTATGGRSGSGGTTREGGSGGAGNTGGRDAGEGDAAAGRDARQGDAGATGGTGAFDPCPADGSCKILPLGDSITWGVNYDGGYRVKLFSNSIADKKNLTYVGKLTNGPATIPSGATFPQKNEGHSGWTIQQIDDIVTGKSTDANYSGKKLMVDLAPNIVLLHAGTNDTSRTPTGMADRLGALIDHILADRSDILLVVTTIVPIKQGSYGTIGESYNKEVPGVVQKRIDAGKHVLLVDMFKDFPSNGLGGDGVHPNQTGYDWMAGVWYDAIKKVLH